MDLHRSVEKAAADRWESEDEDKYDQGDQANWIETRLDKETADEEEWEDVPSQYRKDCTTERIK